MSQTLSLVALGGALGSVLRYLMVTVIGAPLGTAAVNVLGSFAIGALFIALAGRSDWQVFLMTGVLGGFTTFSAFSLDTLRLLEQGQPVQALGYALGSIVLSLIAAGLGITLMRITL